jgi:hypothetical protein
MLLSLRAIDQIDLYYRPLAGIAWRHRSIIVNQT